MDAAVVELERILSLHPRMRDAVQPASLPFVRGQFHFNPSEEWSSLCSRRAEFRFRGSDPQNWCGPFHAVGDCLDGFWSEGDFHYFDPSIEPKEDDFVLIAWGERDRAQRAFQSAREYWIDRYGNEPGPIATKWLRRLGSQWLLVVRNSFFFLNDSRILGVMVHRESPSPTSMQIGPGAATGIQFVSDQGPDSFNPAAGGDGYLSISGSGIDSASVLNGTLSFDADIVDPVGTLANVSLLVSWSGGGESSLVVSPQHTDTRSYAVQESFATLPANTAWTMKISISGNANLTMRRASILAEVIKR